MTDDRTSPSRLANQPSPYLRSAADQPVDWYPWGAEAFARAQDEDKPILLDVGAVWCHWCHVMDRESYEDPEVAALLRERWVCIKVDRDERPDVDARYQRAVQALTGQGGWPLTAFLTPDGSVFFGGTYFPPDGAHGRPGFRALLGQLADVYHDRRDQVRAQAAEISKHIRTRSGVPPAGDLTPDLLDRAADGMRRMYDPRHGGFGDTPKFPHPGACEFLLDRALDADDHETLQIVTTTLAGMAEGGIRDHLGGGFHRYSVDTRWIVPHFEKTLYDNSELLRVYIHTASAAPTNSADPAARLHREVISGIVHWVTTTMSDPGGGYFSSQDADVGMEDDGDYFTWTVDEARAVLDADEFAVAADYYDIDERGEMRHDPARNVLWVRLPVADIARKHELSEEGVRKLLETVRAKLLTARERRPAPFVDRTCYTGWSALMASAMLEAGAYLERDDLASHALRTADRLFGEAALDDGVPHAIGSDVSGLLEDQVYLAAAAVDAHEATGEMRWLERATGLMEHVWSRYRSARGGLCDRPVDEGGDGFLEHQVLPIQDAPTPSPNGVAGITLARLAELTNDERWRQRRDELLTSFAGGAADLSVFGATLHRALAWALLPPTHIAVVGTEGEVEPLHHSACKVYRPRKVIHRLQPEARAAGLPPVLQAMLDGSTPRAYVCAGTQCAPPVTTAEELEHVLYTFARGGRG